MIFWLILYSVLLHVNKDSPLTSNNGRDGEQQPMHGVCPKGQEIAEQTICTLHDGSSGLHRRGTLKPASNMSYSHKDSILSAESNTGHDQIKRSAQGNPNDFSCIRQILTI